jgi:hypothetical protein
MKVHGKAFKKAQTGTAISKAQNYASLDANNNGILDAMENPGGFNASAMGQTGNYADTQGSNTNTNTNVSSSGNSGTGITYSQDPVNFWENEQSTQSTQGVQGNPYGTFAPGNVNSWDIDNNGIPDTIQQAEGNPLMNNNSSSPSPEKKEGSFDVSGAMNFVGGLMEAGEGIKAAEDLTKNLETWAKVSDVQKNAEISNFFVPEQEREYYRPDELKNIYAANERYNTVGRGTDVFNVQNGSMIGGNPTEIQNMYSNEMTLYDDLGYEPLYESDNDRPIKTYQGGGGFGNMLGGGDAKPFLGGSALGQGGLFGGGNGGGSWLAGAMGGNSSYAKAASMIPGPVGMFATMAAQMFDPNPGKQRNAMNKINSNRAFGDRLAASKNITGGLSNMGVGQNGQNLEMYEEGGYMNPEYNPQVITMFGDHTAEDFADYAHKYRAGGHLKSYTPPSERAMETYAMGGKIQSHWGGNVEDVSYNPYMPGSGITSIIKGPSHKNGGVGISYGGGKSQNGYGYAASGANMEAQIEAEGGESMIEMEEGGVMNPQTGELDTNAVVIGNITMNAKMAEATGDADLIEIAKENPNTSMKKIFEIYTAQEVKATKDLEKAAKLANEAKSPLEEKTAETIANSAKERLKLFAKKKIKMAKYQDTLHKIKDSISQSRGKNISAEALGRGQIKDDLDPVTKDAPIGNAKSGAYIRKAQTGIGYDSQLEEEEEDIPYTYSNNNVQPTPLDEVVIKAIPKSQQQAVANTNNQDPILTEEEYNEFLEEYEQSKATGSKKNPVNLKFQRHYHKKFPNEALAAIQKITKEKGLSKKAKEMGLTADDILAGKDVQKILESNEDEYYGPITDLYKANVNSAYKKKSDNTSSLKLNSLGTNGESKTDKKGIDVVPLKKNNVLDAFGMISQLFQNRSFPPMDPRQFAGEYVALAQNTPRPVPMQKPYVELDPIYRMNYNDVRANNTAAFRDMLRQNEGNPVADAIAFAKFAQQNQPIGGEEFRTNQAIEQQVYGGNRAKMNANLEKGLQLNANQANLQSIADSTGRAITQKAIASMSDKEMKYTADKNKFLTARNLFPKYGYGANYQTQMQGPGYNPVIPQIAGGKSTIQQVPVYKDGVLDHYEMIEGDDTTTDTTTLAPWQTPPFVATKNGGKVKKNYKNSSVVRAYKNL